MPSDQNKYDAGAQHSVNEKKNRARAQREKEENEMKKVLSTYEGRSVLWRVLEYSGIYAQSFTGNSETFFREGKRSVGLDLLARIEAAEEGAYGKMRDEAVDRQKGRKL